MILSENAAKLLSALRQRPLHEQDAIKVLFPEPKYIGTLDPDFDTETKESVQKAYWQWDVNLYGQNHSRPVNGTHFYFIATANYSDVTYAAYKELKEAGYAYSSNNGYNTYTYRLI